MSRIMRVLLRIIEKNKSGTPGGHLLYGKLIPLKPSPLHLFASPPLSFLLRQKCCVPSAVLYLQDY